MPFSPSDQSEFPGETSKESLSEVLKKKYSPANKPADEILRQSYIPDLGLAEDVPFPPPAHPKFTFIDLFAGIGGFRQALQSLGGKCLFSSEWDEQAQKTYYANYGDMPYGDITLRSTKDAIPGLTQVFSAACVPVVPSHDDRTLPV